MYRFRKIEYLLDKFHELENQEIFFASPDKLNDPMEGFRDIFWKGDRIVWENLLKHYIFCLEHFYTLTLIAADTHKLSVKDIPLSNYPFTNIAPQKMALASKVSEQFFNNTFIMELAQSLERRNNPVRRGELLSYLLYVHHYALTAIEEVYLQEGIVQKALFKFDSSGMNELFNQKENLVEIINRVEIENSNDPGKVETFFQLMQTIKHGYSLSNAIAFGQEFNNSNTVLLLNNFPEMFIAKLETLIYPNWYSASFLKSCTNPAIWGYYGEEHKGVCLIFSENQKGDRLQLKLNSQDRDYRPVAYHKKHVKVDFFRSLGGSSIDFLKSQWYLSEGKLSICARHLQKDTDKWRKKFWDNFYNSLLIKLKEWKYEGEYRIILEEIIGDFAEEKIRTLKYEFEDLKGIIFGIKTSQEDKLKIIRIIKNKCRLSGRKEFDFFQAYYSKKTGLIEKLPLNLL